MEQLLLQKMDLLVWLVLVSALGVEGGRGRSRGGYRGDKEISEDITDEELLEILSDLILESEGARKGRSESEFERQVDGFGGTPSGFAPSESCVQVGVEFLNKTECKEVFEIECEDVNVTKYRTEIGDKCETIIDKRCDLRMTEVPEQKCNERMRNK